MNGLNILEYLRYGLFNLWLSLGRRKPALHTHSLTCSKIICISRPNPGQHIALLYLLYLSTNRNIKCRSDGVGRSTVVLLVHLCRPCKHHLFDPCIISVIISTNCIRRPCSMTTDTPKSRPGVQPDILSFLTCQSGYYGGGVRSAKRNCLLAAP